MNVTILAIGALVVAALVAGAGWKGYGLGADHVRADWAEAAAASVKAAQENAESERQAARKSAATLQAALVKQRELSRDLGTALEAHIRALPVPPAGCPEPRLTDGLLDDLNRALAGAGAPGRSLPTGSRTPAEPDRSDATGPSAITR